MPRQIANLIGLIIIVTFGSSLDVAAIQAELPTRKLDYNKELTAIGWGNLFSSCLVTNWVRPANPGVKAGDIKDLYWLASNG